MPARSKPIRNIVLPMILGSRFFLGCVPSSSCNEEWVLLEEEKLNSIREHLQVLANGLIAGAHGFTATFELELSGHDELMIQLSNSGTDSDILDVYANGARSDTFMIVGTNGLVRFSEDNGSSWSDSDILPLALTNEARLNTVDFGCSD